MKKFASLASLAAVASIALFSASAASAQTAYGQIGTTGLTLGYAQHYGAVSLRGDVNLMNYSRNIDTDDIQYDAKLKFSTIGLFADYFPAGQFRVTGGLFLGKDKITARATTGILAGEWATGSIKSSTARPYLGIGWGLGGQAGKGLSFAADLGASYGKFKTEYEVSPNLQSAWGDARVQKERNDLDSKINDMKWFPVVRIGVAYRY